MTEPAGPNSKFSQTRTVLWQVLFLNLLVAILKIGAGLFSGLLSMVADGFHSILDSSGNVIGLIALQIAQAPPDDEHPYGHRKAETLASLFIGVMLIFAAYEILSNAVGRLLEAKALLISPISFAVMITTILINLGVTIYEQRRGQSLNSEILLADALHTRSDIWVSLSVVGGLIGISLGWVWLDAAVSMVIAAIIGYSAFKILKKSITVLMDQAILPSDNIEALALEMPGVESVERIRSRGRRDETYVDLHVRVKPDMPIDKAHSISHAVQRKITDAYPQAADVTIHIEPEQTLQSVDTNIASQLHAIAHSLGGSAHEIWKHKINGHYFVELHLEVPPALSLAEAHSLASQLEERGKAALPHVAAITTHIEPMGETNETAVLLEDDTVRKIKAQAKQIADRICGADSSHNLQLWAEPGGFALSLHCALPPTLSIVEAHTASERVKDAIRREIPQLKRVVVHVEPPAAEQAPPQPAEMASS